MSPLPRLHHRDIMIIVELFIILTIVTVTFLTRTKKRKGKTPFLGLALTLIVTLRPDLTIQLQGTADDFSALCYL